MTVDNGIGETVDRKFIIRATSVEHDHEYNEDHAVLLLAKDRAVPATLRFYREECIRLGAAVEQVAGVELLIERVDRYQAANPSYLKVPDVDPIKGAFITEPNRSI